MFNSNSSNSKIFWRITFIRENHPEYGPIINGVYASSAEAAVEHIKSSYGENSKILEVK